MAISNKLEKAGKAFKDAILRIQVYYDREKLLATKGAKPLSVPCPQSPELVLFCQWRMGNNCADYTRRSACTGRGYEIK